MDIVLRLREIIKEIESKSSNDFVHIVQVKTPLKKLEREILSNK